MDLLLENGFSDIRYFYHSNIILYQGRVQGVYIHSIQTTYTVALSRFIELYTRGAHLNYSASSHGLNAHLSCTIQINHSRL